MPYGKILVGTDGSETASRAVRAAAAIARATGAELLIASAADRPEAAAAAVEPAAERARREGLAVSVLPRVGRPADVIVELADRLDAGLIVLGNRGMGGGRRFLLGSVPVRVSHHAPCDVVIVRTAGETGRTPGRYERILIATDGSSTADRAARRGHRLAQTLGATITLLYVGFPATGEAILRDTAAELGDAVPIETLALDGDPADTIIEAARTTRVDLVVVGSKGMERRGPFLLGAVPNKVAHDASTDVLIAKTYSLAFSDLARGEGAIVADDRQKLAVYRHDDGTVYAFSAKCQHMGCTVGWNAQERTWDCPCHGSRYQYDGSVLNGPATRPLVLAEP